ncbi:MAG: PEP/pyruvate-binding domain-containing protein, partial [Candidatus Paceibacteria bacterium]
MAKRFIVWFKDISMKDVALVGGKNAALGEMYSKLQSRGIRIPNGFAITADAYRYFLKSAGLEKKIKEVLASLNFHNIRDLKVRGKKIRQLILGANLPPDLQDAISYAYKKLSNQYGIRNLDVAVRSSATAEDLPQASFAGQQETFLNIRGKAQLLEAVKKCFASLFTDRAIFYRAELKFDHLKVALSVGVQKMVRADKGASGVMFSCDTESGFPDVVLINASYGLGENVVQGKVNPDQYYVFETTFKQGYKPIIGKVLGSKDVKMIYTKGKKSTKNVKVAFEDRIKFALNDDEILTLASWSMLIENHYKKPMDMEWARDGIDGKLYILQARPETVKSRRNINELEVYEILKKSKVKILTQGLSVGDKIGYGRARVILDVKDIDKFQKGEVLVT